MCDKSVFSRALPIFVLAIGWLQMPSLAAAPWDPAAADYSGSKGKTIYVSKQGDGSDGRSWATAFRTIQAALLAVPDDRGGHRVVVRPDTYEEANLYPAFRGAKSSYNLLVGDCDGRLGSGATGWVVIESSCPGVAVRTDPSKPTGNPTWKIIQSDLPETGLKCVDWWGPLQVRARILRRDLGPLDLSQSVRLRLRGRPRLGPYL